MQNTKFTPGPWCVNPKVKTSINTVADGQGMVIIAHCDDPDDIRPRSVDEANARLIASAPELLDALQRIANSCAFALPFLPVKQQAGIRAIIDEADAAIAKATGKEGA